MTSRENRGLRRGGGSGGAIAQTTTPQRIPKGYPEGAKHARTPCIVARDAYTVTYTATGRGMIGI